ncbi:MAG: XrtA/PEP-CTERM system-associated ATPase [Thermodesulfovibrionales bacterium]
MYTSYFNFTCKPFQLTPDPEFLYLSRVHKKALTYLNYGIAENSGFILLTGEIGTGKTTILRSMIKKIPQDIKLARINNTKVSSEQLISMINEDFGLETKGLDKTHLLSKLTDFLITQYGQGGRSMIIIDEAQNLSPDLLEEIRMLSNLETDKSKLLQIILVGQPELNIKLSRPELEQLRQRITISTHISPLAREELESYIKFRLRVAGNEEAVTFEEGIIDAIYDFSKGIPRLINILCDFTLLTAFTDDKKIIDIGLIQEVINDLVNESPETKAANSSTECGISADNFEKIEKVLSSIHVRLQNLEAVINDMQKKNDIYDKNKRLLALVNACRPLKPASYSFDESKNIMNIKGAELNKKEAELQKMEHELYEKDTILNKNKTAMPS